MMGIKKKGTAEENGSFKPLYKAVAALCIDQNIIR